MTASALLLLFTHSPLYMHGSTVHAKECVRAAETALHLNRALCLIRQRKDKTLQSR